MRGRLFPHRCDLSPDGKWFVYLAMPERGCDTFNAVSRPPRLIVAAQWKTYGTWFGGGLWRSSSELAVNIDRSCGNTSLPTIQYRRGSADAEDLARTVKLDVLDPHGFGEDEGILYQRLERDGWKWVTPADIDARKRQLLTWKASSESENLSDVSAVTAARLQKEPDAEWSLRPSPQHPTLRLVQRPYDNGRHFRFSLDDLPGILDEQVHWACYDSTGALLVSRRGWIHRWTLDELLDQRAQPGFSMDLNPLAPPPRDSKSGQRQEEKPETGSGDGS
jgi:hypothetical protein